MNLHDRKVVQQDRRLRRALWIVSESSQRPATHVVPLVVRSDAQTNVFLAAGADRLDNVVHHDRAGGRQLWYLLQRGAFHHQGLVGEFLPFHLHYNYCTIILALL